MPISVTNIVKSFGHQKILDDVSFELKKGEIVGFLGPNGAGKSTLMRILTTYYNADSGSATVNGFDVRTSPRQVRQSIGYLPEHNPLYTEMYVREYLGFVAQMHKVQKNRTQEVITQTGLTPEAHKKIRQLSKGYRQRVGLAAALLHEPEVLLLDEPTTGLDPNQLIDIRKLIRNIGQTKTILLSTHIMKEVEAVCDRVIIINKGSIVADNPLDELRQSESQRIVVEFDYRVEEALLQRMPHVASIKNTGGFVYEILFDTDMDMRPTLFDFAHDHQLKTLQLARKSDSLERLFTELTG